MRVEQQAVMALLPDPAGQRVVDAGCGTGRYARLLKDAGAASVIGIDRSAAMLSHACQCGATYVRADIRALPLPAMSADLIVSGLMLPDVDELGRVLAEWHRVLKPGGVIVCSTLHPVGAELGWTRTFDTPRGTRSIPAHWHTLDEHRLACREAGLIADAVAEPGLSSRAVVTARDWRRHRCQWRWFFAPGARGCRDLECAGGDVHQRARCDAR